MAFSEVFVALQTGVIDGQENPLGTIYASKFYEVQKYVSLTGHVYIPAYLATGNRTWKRLPQNVKKAIQESARAVLPAMYARGKQDDADLVAKLKAKGVQVNIANREKFVSSSQPVYEEFMAKVPSGKN